MLPDLALPVHLNGTTAHLIARDVPTAVFFAGWPGDRAHREHLELWRERLLTRIVVEPSPLTQEVILGLGDAAGPPLSAYLRAVGWPEAAYPEAEVQVAPAVAPAARALLVAPGDLVATPHPHVAGRLAEFAETWHLNPAALWQGPVSEFLWLIRLMRAQQQGHDPAVAWTDEDGIGVEEA